MLQSAIIRCLTGEHHLAYRQFTRFALGGAGVAVISVAVYWLLAVTFSLNPILANFAQYATNVTLGFLIHKAWTFSETVRDDRASHAPAKYVGVSLLALTMNTAWTWALTELIRLPVWTPIVPMVFLTPLMTFLINRVWVF